MNDRQEDDLTSRATGMDAPHEQQPGRPGWMHRTNNGQGDREGRPYNTCRRTGDPRGRPGLDTLY